MERLESSLVTVAALLALVTPFFAWLVKRYVDHAVGYRFDMLKAQNAVTFAWQHQHVSKAALDLQQLLVEACTTLGAAAANGYKIDVGPSDSDVRYFTDSVAKLNYAFARDSMFLPTVIRQLVEKAIGLLMFAHNALLQARMFRDSADLQTMSIATATAAQLHEQATSLVTEVEPHFRKLLLGENWGT